ncbi:pantoate--beta-alanine ligase [Myxococcota bacterium]|nr:pantoate--beta-alanine ligase [Myxococcota bacterium]
MRSSLGTDLGFVATMGALHEGHFALVAQSIKERKKTIVSIFVNPTQFDQATDLEAYPNTLDADLEALASLGVDAVFLPSPEELYPDKYNYRITEQLYSKTLCGAHRPGHFDGMLTVVLKLLNIIQPSHAYFGEKDFQQYKLIKGMTEALFIPVEIIPCKTVRDEDGLALSSRNERLSSKARAKAALFPKLLGAELSSASIKAQLEDEGFSVDYIAEEEGRRFGAVTLDGVRLIDNVRI